MRFGKQPKNKKKQQPTNKHFFNDADRNKIIIDFFFFTFYGRWGTSAPVSTIDVLARMWNSVIKICHHCIFSDVQLTMAGNMQSICQDYSGRYPIHIWFFSTYEGCLSRLGLKNVILIIRSLSPVQSVGFCCGCTVILYNSNNSLTVPLYFSCEQALKIQHTFIQLVFTFVSCKPRINAVKHTTV